MKRWKICILWCLLLGAVTTIGVAWEFARRKNMTRYTTIDQSTRAIEELRSEFGDAAWVRPHWGRSEGMGVLLVELVGEPGDELQVYYRVVVSSGWPILAMKGVSRFGSTGETLLFGIRLEENKSKYPERFLPLLPAWPGFVFDALFYGVIWYGLFLGVSAGRRWIRRTRGRCLSCNYDLQHALDAGCPECGWNRPPSRPPELES